MPNAVSTALKNHFGSEVTTLAVLLTIRLRNNRMIRATDHDADIIYDGNTYLSSLSFTRSASQSSQDFSVANLTIQSVLSQAGISREEIRGGLLDYASVTLEIINYESPADGVMILRSGWLGECKITDTGDFQVELRGLSQGLSVKPLRSYSANCRVDLGAPACQVPLFPDVVQRETVYSVGDFVRVETDGSFSDQRRFENRIYECTTAGETAVSEPTYDTTVDSTTSDGTAVFTARQSWTRHFNVTATDSNRSFTIGYSEPRASDDTWFRWGRIRFQTGDNDNIVSQIVEFGYSTGVITLLEPLPFAPSVGDRGFITPGCDKTLGSAGCARFDNKINFQGFPYIPGEDYIFKGPRQASSVAEAQADTVDLDVGFSGPEDR